MPRISDMQLAKLAAVWEEYDYPDHWHRSRNGNLYRYWNGRCVTVFRRYWKFGWCIQKDDGPEYSPRYYDDEESARIALGEVLI